VALLALIFDHADFAETDQKTFLAMALKECLYQCRDSHAALTLALFLPQTDSNESKLERSAALKKEAVHAGKERDGIWYKSSANRHRKPPQAVWLRTHTLYGK
jgi:hypothetical protein